MGPVLNSSREAGKLYFPECEISLCLPKENASWQSLCLCLLKWLVYTKCFINACGMNNQMYGNWAAAGVPGPSPASCVL